MTFAGLEGLLGRRISRPSCGSQGLDDPDWSKNEDRGGGGVTLSFYVYMTKVVRGGLRGPYLDLQSHFFLGGVTRLHRFTYSESCYDWLTPRSQYGRHSKFAEVERLERIIISVRCNELAKWG
jgi:hypothetical protein